MMYDYRLLDDPKQIGPIATAAFALRVPEQEGLTQWLASSLEHGRKLYGVYDGDRLLSGFMLYDYQMRLRDSVVPMAGIGLLCSRLDARGKGAVRQMIRGGIATMKANGDAVSVLDPFDESFYRNYGWEKFSRLQVVDITPGLLRIPDDPDVTIDAVDLPFPDEACMTFYNAYAAKRYNLVQRGRREWENRTALRAWNLDAAARGVVRFTRDDRVVALLGYGLERKASESRTTFAANLLAYEEDSALRAMLRYMKRLSHQVSKLRIDLPLDVELWPYLSHRPNQTAVRDVFMIRIIDLLALNGLRLQAPDLSLSIEVADAQAPWNQGTWEISIQDGTLDVRPGTSADLRCGIGALSAVVSGFSSFAELIGAGRAEPLSSYRGQDLPKATTFLADYF